MNVLDMNGWVERPHAAGRLDREYRLRSATLTSTRLVEIARNCELRLETHHTEVTVLGRTPLICLDFRAGVRIEIPKRDLAEPVRVHTWARDLQLWQHIVACFHVHLVRMH